LSLRFGVTPTDGPRIVRLLANGKTQLEVTFDLSRHISEVLAGVAKANADFGGALQVEEIEVVPDDYPKKAQAEHAAYRIAQVVIQGEI